MAPLNLYYTAPPLEHGHALPGSFRMVGPGLWEPPVDMPAWLADVDEPLVVVASSSEFQRDDAIIENVLAAMRVEDVQVVVTSAAHDPRRFHPPRNARVIRWPPHGSLLRGAACVVCHGGMGVTQKALAAGVPVCVVPFGRDQFEVAQQVTRAGGGTRISPSELTPGSVRTAIRTAMTMRAGAQRIAAELARAGGAPAAADALERLLPQPSPVTARASRTPESVVADGL